MQTDRNLYDLIIVGGGPAGLSAAIYMARAKYRVLVVEKSGIGGQITITDEIVNYPGIERTGGKELTEKMHRQAESFGARFLIAEVKDMDLASDIKVLHTTKGEYKTLGVILATGANPRRLGFDGECEFQGRGVAYCATCDGEFFTGLEVFVIGGGYAAVEEGLFLTKYAKKVTFIVRKDRFSCARTVSDKLEGEEKIQVLFETELIGAGGEQMLEYARFRNSRTGEEWTYKAADGTTFGIFVFAGYVPNTEWIGKEVARDEQGYLLTDENQKTNLDGVYAAGDVCVKNLRQVVTAVSDGAVAATSLEKDVENLHKRLGIPQLHREESSRQSERAFLNDDIKQQLQGIFDRFEQSVHLRVWLDDRPVSGEVIDFMKELEKMTDKISWEKAEIVEAGIKRMLPSIEVCREDKTESGIEFHGVPGGHEFNSFIIALYNVAGPGQEIEREVFDKLKNLEQKMNIKVLVSLSCTMCPETVMSAQKAAAISDKVEAEMYDLAHFPELKEKYKVMSVPCMIINDEKILFGKKKVAEVADILAGQAY